MNHKRYETKGKCLVCPDCASSDVDVKVWANASDVANAVDLKEYQDCEENAHCNTCMSEQKHLAVADFSVEKK